MNQNIAAITWFVWLASGVVLGYYAVAHQNVTALGFLFVGLAVEMHRRDG